MPELTAERLRELLHYDPETGLFTWIVNRGCIKAGTQAGCIDDGYVKILVCGRKYRANRLAWLYMTGEWPRKLVDHEDTDRANNRWSNLRELTFVENLQNRRKARSDSRTGLLGVTYDKRANLYFARIVVNGKRLRFGYSQDPEVSSRAYVEAKRRLHPGCTL